MANFGDGIFCERETKPSELIITVLVLVTVGRRRCTVTEDVITMQYALAVKCAYDDIVQS